MAAVLRAIPAADRDGIVENGEDLVVHCRFCRTRYRLSIPDCLAVWQEKKGKGMGPRA
jgi:redox-regulated HSP33 family molecular chaperone